MKADEVSRNIKKINSDDYLERCDAVEYLGKYRNDPKIVSILIEMLDDKNYLVRCEVCDALYGYKNETVLNKLISKLPNEQSTTVRMYIISTISSIIGFAPNKSLIYSKLYNLFLREKSKKVIIAYWTLFYLLTGELDYINKVLLYLNDNSYHLRCNAINLLNEIVDKNNITSILDAYQRRLQIENIFCVKELLKKSLMYYSVYSNKT